MSKKVRTVWNSRAIKMKQRLFWISGRFSIVEKIQSPFKWKRGPVFIAQGKLTFPFVHQSLDHNVARVLILEYNAVSSNDVAA
jgi:hypothetical protein